MASGGTGRPRMVMTFTSTSIGAGHGVGADSSKVSGGDHHHEPKASSCQNCFKAVERFPKHTLVKGDPVGSGGFGSVIKGFLNAVENPKASGDVVVKMLHAPIGMKRYAVFQEMFNLHHCNLIRFLGIVDTDPLDCPQLIFKCANEGNLLDYTKNSNNSKDLFNKLALDVIHGMEYLHQMNFIHGCLSARNILLDEFRGFTNAKISDYGMNRVITGSGPNYFNYTGGRSIPIRWLPKECVAVDKNQGEIIKPSDVWSFSVVLWELWTRGEVPYGLHGTNLEVKQHILNGSSPFAFRRPDNCPPTVLHVMENIFVVDPEQRPTFKVLRMMFTPPPVVQSTPKASLQSDSSFRNAGHNHNPNDKPSHRGGARRGRRGASSTRGSEWGRGRSKYGIPHTNEYNFNMEHGHHKDVDANGGLFNDEDRHNADVHAKREEYRTNKPQPSDGEHLDVISIDHSFKPDFIRNKPKFQQHRQDPKTYRGRIFHNANNRPALLPTPNAVKGGPQFPLACGTGVHTLMPLMQHQQSYRPNLPPPYDNFHGAPPPPYFEDTKPGKEIFGRKSNSDMPKHGQMSAHDLFDGRKSDQKEKLDLQKTVLDLQTKMKLMELRQDKEKCQAEEVEKSKQAALEEKRKQAAEILKETRRQMVEVEKKEKEKMLAEEEEALRQQKAIENEHAAVAAAERKRKTLELHQQHIRQQQELRNEMEARRIQNELNAKRVQEEQDALHAQQLQKEELDWEEEQQKKKMDAINANEKRKRAFVDELKQMQGIVSSAIPLHLHTNAQVQTRAGTENAQNQNLFNTGRSSFSPSTSVATGPDSGYSTTAPARSRARPSSNQKQPTPKENCVTM